MANEPFELAAKDVFVLLDVPVPENLETDSKWLEQGDTKDDDDESHFSLDIDDKVQINVSNFTPNKLTIVFIYAHRLLVDI